MRFWTVPEARAYLPRLRQLIDVLATAALTGVRARGNGKGSVRADGGRPAVTPGSALGELQEGGIILRDASQLRRRVHRDGDRARDEDGVVYFLCWHREDGDLGWWHLPEDGFAGREPLPRRPGSPEGHVGPAGSDDPGEPPQPQEPDE